MDVSVIICAHNEERYLPAQLRALRSQEWDGEWEVVVVDNRSSDTTAEIVAAQAAQDSRFRLVRAEDRAGQSYAMNVGGRATRSKWLAFCDADDVVGAGWLAAIAVGLEQHEVVTGPHELDLLNPRWLADSRGRSGELPIGSFFGIFRRSAAQIGASDGTHGKELTASARTSGPGRTLTCPCAAGWQTSRSWDYPML